MFSVLAGLGTKVHFIFGSLGLSIKNMVNTEYSSSVWNLVWPHFVFYSNCVLCPENSLWRKATFRCFGGPADRVDWYQVLMQRRRRKWRRKTRRIWRRPALGPRYCHSAPLPQTPAPPTTPPPPAHPPTTPTPPTPPTPSEWKHYWPQSTTSRWMCTRQCHTPTHILTSNWCLHSKITNVLWNNDIQVKLGRSSACGQKWQMFFYC